MKPINALDYPIVFNEEGMPALNRFIAQENYSKIFVLVDTNTHIHCLSPFLSALETSLEIEVIEIDNGEEFKTIETCEGVWDALVHLGADRNSCLINLGGGVVTDLGGFVAATYKRGMDFINVPTTLLSMVDASVGGKTGVDLGSLKNLIGVIKNPKMVVVLTGYLESLPAKEMRSGLAEIYKHGLIADQEYWKNLTKLKELTTDDLSQIIYDSVLIKNKIVLKDPFEQSLRKTLNYGHTLGHAIESYCLKSEHKTTLLHGEAIAIGMILESYLSHHICKLEVEILNEISDVLTAMYEHTSFTPIEIKAIIENLKFDKKNSKGEINFVLLKDIGVPVIDQQASNALIVDAFAYYDKQYS